jgi:tryptophan synthase alpha chain
VTRISGAFKKNKKTLIVFIMAGDPSLAKTEKLVYEIEKAGADIIELGIPFSDSIADGPTIQEAALRALKNNVSAADAIKLAKKIRKNSSIPLIFMTSYNIVFSYGADMFAGEAAAAGVDGLILPDLPIEEADQMKKHGMDIILLVAPNSSEEHIKLAAKNSSGFIYMISLAGTTGASANMDLDIKGIISSMRKTSKTPIAIGFGISNSAQAAAAAKLADGIIVGSAVIDVISKKSGNVGKFVASLKKAINR